MLRYEQDRKIRLGAGVVVFVCVSLLALDLLGRQPVFGQDLPYEAAAEPAQLWSGEPEQEPLGVGCAGDADCSGKVDFADINPFVLALGSPDSYRAKYPNCNIQSADVDQDGYITFADINPLVELMRQGKECQPYADFQILEFLGSDPNGRYVYKRWDNPKDPNEVAGPIEYGLRVTLDASLSGGEDWYLYRWEFGDGIYHYVEGTPRFTRVFTEDRPINLKVYTRDRGKSACMKKTIKVQADLDFLGSCNRIVGSRQGTYETHDMLEIPGENGSTLWTISIQGELASVPLTDPTFGSVAMQVHAHDVLEVRAMDYASLADGYGNTRRYLFLARFSYGVDVWRVDGATPQFVQNLRPPAPYEAQARALCVLADKLVVGCSPSGLVFTYSLARLVQDGKLSAPTESIHAEQDVLELRAMRGRVFVGGNTRWLGVLQWADGKASLRKVELENHIPVYRLVGAGSLLYVQHGAGVSAVDADTLEPRGFLPGVAAALAPSGARLFDVALESSGRIRKYDVAAFANAYPMSEVSNVGFGPSAAVVTEIDGQLCLLTGPRYIRSWTVAQKP